MENILNTIGISGDTLLQILLTLFVAILFLQSGLDKVFNYKGEQAFYKEHFKKTFLKNTVPLLMPTITIAELAAGIFCGIGVLTLLFTGNTSMGFIGMLLAALSIIMLFFGQRIAKDFGGAASLVPYFLLTIVGLYSYMI
ncbi:MAG: DoxX family protein [Bacteroidota bacterium]